MNAPKAATPPPLHPPTMLGKERMVAPLAGKGYWHRCKVIDQSACGRFIKVDGARSFGRARWVAAADTKSPADYFSPEAVRARTVARQAAGKLRSIRKEVKRG